MRRSPLAFLMATMALDAIGIGLIFPVMPDLIADVRGGSLADAALWGGVLATAFAAMQFLCAPVIGALSDRFGRRPVLLAALLLIALDHVAVALAHSVWLLLVLRLIGGATAATHSTLNASAADLTPPERRAQAFGLLGASFMGGFILGPVIGGLLGEWGPRVPFWAAAALALVNLAWGWAVLPETVTDATRRPFHVARANPLGALRHVARLPGAPRLLVVLLLAELAFVAYGSVWAFWGKAAFGWSPLLVGASLAAFGAAAAVVQGWAIGPIVARLGEPRTIAWGLAFNAATFVIFGLAPANAVGAALALAWCPVSALGEVVLPALLARLSRLAPPDAQGEMQGVTASLRSAATMVGPLLFTGAFALGGLVPPTGAGLHLLGLPFLLAAGLMTASLLVLRRPGAT